MIENYSEQSGFTIEVKAGDVVDSEGPPTTVAIDGAMWVPKGSTLNGKLVEYDGPQNRTS
jgi:hypothetical protein